MHPGCCFHDSERAGEDHGEPQGCLLVSKSLAEQFHPRSAGAGGAAAGSLSFKGRTQCKPWSSSASAIKAGCTPLAKKARQRSSPLLPQFLLNIIYFIAPCSLAEEAAGAGTRSLS